MKHIHVCVLVSGGNHIYTPIFSQLLHRREIKSFCLQYNNYENVEFRKERHKNLRDSEEENSTIFFKRDREFYKSEFDTKLSQ